MFCDRINEHVDFERCNLCNEENDPHSCDSDVRRQLLGIKVKEVPMIGLLFDDDLNFVCAPENDFRDEEDFKEYVIKQFPLIEEFLVLEDVINIRVEAMISSEQTLHAGKITPIHLAKVTISNYFTGELVLREE